MTRRNGASIADFSVRLWLPNKKLDGSRAGENNHEVIIHQILLRAQHIINNQKTKGNNMSCQYDHTDVRFRVNESMEEKIVYFTAAAVDRAVAENRLPAAIGEQLKAVLNRPGEDAAVFEWNGMTSYQKQESNRVKVRILCGDASLGNPLHFGGH